MPQAQPELKKVSPLRQIKLPLPNLNKYLEKRVLVQLNGSRKVMGILRGYDVHSEEVQISRLMADHIQVYLNIVLDEALEEKAGGEKVRIGMVVIRGNAVVMLEVRAIHCFFMLETSLTRI
jgi:small nuclear ribonucleoprotein G